MTITSAFFENQGNRTRLEKLRELNSSLGQGARQLPERRSSEILLRVCSYRPVDTTGTDCIQRTLELLAPTVKDWELLADCCVACDDAENENGWAYYI
jgi:hypothetical protein